MMDLLIGIPCPFIFLLCDLCVSSYGKEEEARYLLRPLARPIAVRVRQIGSAIFKGKP